MGHFNMWDNILDCSKVQTLPGELFKWWINLLAVVNREGGVDGEIPPKMSLVFATRIPAKTVVDRLSKLKKLGLIDSIDKSPIGGMLFKIHDWSQWQKPKDITAADRQRRFRERNALRHALRHGDVTRDNRDETPLHNAESNADVTPCNDPQFNEGNEEILPVGSTAFSGIPARNPPPVQDESFARFLAEEKRHREAGARLSAKPEPDVTPRQS